MSIHCGYGHTLAQSVRVSVFQAVSCGLISCLTPAVNLVVGHTHMHKHSGFEQMRSTQSHSFDLAAVSWLHLTRSYMHTAAHSAQSNPWQHALGPVEAALSWGKTTMCDNGWRWWPQCTPPIGCVPCRDCTPLADSGGVLRWKVRIDSTAASSRCCGTC